MCKNNLLYKKENKVTQQGLNEPEHFEREKYYTKGGGINFPMIMKKVSISPLTGTECFDSAHTCDPIT